MFWMVNFLIIALKFNIGFYLAMIIGLLLSTRNSKIIRRSIVASLCMTMIGFVFIYMVLPPQTLSNLVVINILSYVFGVFIFTMLNVGTVLKNINVKPKRKKNVIQAQSVGGIKLTKALFAGIVALVIVVIYVPVARILSTDEIYQTINVKKVKETEELVSTKETPIAMSTKSARNKMQKMISSVPNYSAYKLGTTTAQVIDGEYVYVSGIEYRSFWKWNRFKKMPGYFKISATDINAQPEFVKTEMKYVPSAYLWQDAERNIYASSSSYARMGAVNLEIGDDGTPYYVTTLYKEYGLSGKKRYDKFKVGVLNSQTGKTIVYDLKDTPEYIDAPLTSAVASSMNNYFGKYGKGWLNSIFTKDDVKQPTSNGIYSSGAVTPLMSKSGHLLYFTDFTSDDAKQDSALGYSLIDARTGIMEYYRDNKGMMDSDGAISIAEKIYPEKKWDAKMPILYNVEGVPTWIISLLDVNGIFKGYVYVSATDSDIVVDGNDAQKTLEAYKVRLSMKGSNNRNTTKTELESISGEVQRVNKVVIDGTETISFLLKGNNTVYTISTSNNIYSMFLKEGDKVSFKANKSKDDKVSTIEDITIEDVTP
ncbi:DNA-binding protein [Vagococcus silagei]|uniref:DNA-binding protein n=1 Tax=Vagococcus silagei TaxID=2508885 RepID=A0A4V3TV86_9ENTE|nr:DNA-binding protein [Vagococcus silagei]THB61969.1 DNA-binding protein [Vagococcus silagei]